MSGRSGSAWRHGSCTTRQSPQSANGRDPWICIAYASLAVISVALIAPSMWRAVKGSRDHSRAVVWLAASE